MIRKYHFFTMFHLYSKYWKYYPWQAVLAPIFKMLEAVFGLIVPLVITDIIDNGITNGGGKDLIIRDGLILLALAVIGFLTTMVCQILAVQVSSKFGYYVRNDLFKKINGDSLTNQQAFSSSSLETRLNSDVIFAQKGITLLLRLAIRAPFIVLGAMVMAFIVSPSHGWIFILCGLLLGGVIWLITSLSVPANRKIQKQLDNVSRLGEDALLGSRVIRAFNKEDYEKERFNQEADELERRCQKLNRISVFLSPANSLIVNLGVILILFYGAKDLSGHIGSLTQGNVVALVNFMNQIAAAIVVVANLVVVFSKASSSSQRISEVLEQKNDMASGSSRPSFDKGEVIAFKDVTFTYPASSKPALSHISFQAEKGQTIGVIGGTGSGKTTLADLVARLYDAQDGQILLAGNDIKDIDLSYLRSQVAYVSQKAVLFQGTIEDNLKMANPSLSEEEMAASLKTAQAANVVAAHQGGLQSEVVPEGKNFSGGQKQRLSIARALGKKAPILILDDSSSALDFKTDYELRKALKTDLKGTTVILISQRVSSLKSADKILVLDKGQAVGFDTEENLYASCPVFREIADSQQKGASV